jgi:hypothetical protein
VRGPTTTPPQHNELQRTRDLHIEPTPAGNADATTRRVVAPKSQFQTFGRGSDMHPKHAFSSKVTHFLDERCAKRTDGSFLTSFPHLQISIVKGLTFYLSRTAWTRPRSCIRAAQRECPRKRILQLRSLATDRNGQSSWDGRKPLHGGKRYLGPDRRCCYDDVDCDL